MKDVESAKAAIEAALNSPKVATGVAAYSSSAAIAVNTGVLQGWLATTSLVLGVATGAVVLTFWILKTIKQYRELMRDFDKD